MLPAAAADCNGNRNSVYFFVLLWSKVQRTKKELHLQFYDLNLCCLVNEKVAKTIATVYLIYGDIYNVATTY